MSDAEPFASSQCPVCGVDTPHVHTKDSIASKYREEWLQARFEKGLSEWFITHKNLIPGSYGMGFHLSRKGTNLDSVYDWWPVEMLWKFFRRGASLFTPPYPDGSVPDVNEALEIKKYPFGKEHGEIYRD